MSVAAPIEVAITAYPNSKARVGYLADAASDLRRNLLASRQTIDRIVVSAEEVIPELTRMVRRVCDYFDLELHWRAGPANIGRNHNALDALLTQPIVLWMEEDNRLLLRTDISQDVKFLEEHPDYALVRWHWIVPNTHKGAPLGGAMYEMDPASRWHYSNPIHVRHRRRFARAVGAAEVTDHQVSPQESAANRRLAASGLKVALRHPKPGANWGAVSSWRPTPANLRRDEIPPKWRRFEEEDQ